MSKKRGRPKKNTIVIQTSFSLEKETYEKMLKLMRKRGFDQVGTFLKSLILKEIEES